MKLAHEFYQLPLSFDASKLRQEINVFSESDWVSHHEGFKGNSAIPLISVNGEFNNDFKGVMKPTLALEKTPYIKQVLASFGEVLSRSRLMRLAPGEQVPPHSDINYHWYKRVRIHIPITTTEDVQFYCGDQQVHMSAGQCWIFDSWRYHKVENNSDQYRVHLVIDLAGSSRFWGMINQHSRTLNDNDAKAFDIKAVEFQPNLQPQLLTEKYNAPIIMPVAEIEYLTNELIDEINLNSHNDLTDINEFTALIKDFIADWRVLWLQFECAPLGWPLYHALREQVMQNAHKFENKLCLRNSGPVVMAFAHLVIASCMNTELSGAHQLPKTTTSPASIAKPTTIKPIATTDKTTVDKTLAAPTSRNSPCPCGSGQRYKACHGKVS